jgi:DNA-binding transcriptional MerR regulator
MDNENIYIDIQKVNYKIQNKERGEILYYSINQVADLLNENIDNIKYYTNIFYDLLPIEIIDKELRYTNNDVDKLESLIKFKNKGMSIKEIQDYFNKLPLNVAEGHNQKSNLLSVEELIYSIKEENQLQLNNLKTELISEIQTSNSLYLQNITSVIIEAQNKNFIELKQNLYKEIKEYLDSKFDSIKEVNINLHNELIDSANKFISEKIDSKNTEPTINLENNFNTFSEKSLSNDKDLMKEVKELKGVILNASYIQSDLEMDNNKVGLGDKLLQIIKNR